MSKVFIALKITIYIKEQDLIGMSRVSTEKLKNYKQQPKETPAQTPLQTPVQTPALAASIEGISGPDSENKSTEGKNELLSIS